MICCWEKKPTKKKIAFFLTNTTLPARRPNSLLHYTPLPLTIRSHPTTTIGDTPSSSAASAPTLPSFVMSSETLKLPLSVLMNIPIDHRKPVMLSWTQPLQFLLRPSPLRDARRQMTAVFHEDVKAGVRSVVVRELINRPLQRSGQQAVVARLRWIISRLAIPSA
jgi:hypothetical protein